MAGFGAGEGFTGSSAAGGGGGGPPPEAGGPFAEAGQLFDAEGNPIMLSGQPIDPFGEFGGLCCHVDCEGGPSPECTYVCGDGVVEGPELCDGDCPSSCDDGDACTYEEFFGSADYCYAACLRAPVGCLDGDGCCSDFGFLTGFCNNLNDDDCPAPPGDVGSPCANAEQCMTEPDDPNPDGVACLPARQEDAETIFASAFAGGYCTRLDCAFEGCPEGGTCVQGVPIVFDAGFAIAGACLATCERDADCRTEGYACYDTNDDGTRECYLSGTGNKAFGETCNGIWECSGGADTRCSIPLDFTGGFDEEADGLCTRLCDPTDSEISACPDQYACFGNNTCQPSPDPVNLGGPCTENSDCGGPGINGNRCLTELQGYNGGLCTTGYSDEQCPAGSRYVSVSSTGRDRPAFSGCAIECSGDADCRNEPGHGCIDPGDGEGNVCGGVWDGDTPLGGDCEGNWDCNGAEEQFCANGVCTQSCIETPCPAGFGCFIASCRPTCDSDADCEDDESCIDFQQGVGKVCI